MSKTLAPALRIGWHVVPPELVEPVRRGKLLLDRQTDRIQQHAFADLLTWLNAGRIGVPLRPLRVVDRRTHGWMEFASPAPFQRAGD